MKSPFAPSSGVMQFARFVVVGCVNVFVSFTVFMLFYRLFPLATFLVDATGSFGARLANELARLGVHSIDAGVANTIGALAGMVNSFILNKRWTFAAGGLTKLQVRRFIILNILVIAGGTLNIFVFIDVLRLPYLPIWVLTTGLAMVANFLGNKYWTFAELPDFEAATRRAATDGSA
jgi:putative flippase GtrA